MSTLNVSNIVGNINASSLSLGGTSVTATAAEINKLDGVVGSVVGSTDTQTLTNKTLTSPVINVTSDATGDLYYRTAGGAFQRLPIGTTDQVLTVASGIPSWEDASGGWTEIESNEITSDAVTITYTTTNFSNYNIIKVSVLGAISAADTNAGVNLQVEHSGSWRTIWSVDIGSVNEQDSIAVDVNLYNANDADSSGVVRAAGIGGAGTTLDITNNSGVLTSDTSKLGWSAYTGAITGIRLSITGGPSWEGSTSSSRTNYILYGQ